MYVFLIVLFGMGVAFGALAVSALDVTQRLELGQYLDLFLYSLNDPEAKASPTEVFREALMSNLRTAGFVFLLGLTVIGAPLVPAVIFLRGFIIGFSVGFLLASHGWHGMLISLLALLPQNLLIVPGILVMAAGSLAFAGSVFRRPRGAPSLGKSLLLFGLTTVATTLILIAASLIEGYVAPLFLRLLAAAATHT